MNFFNHIIRTIVGLVFIASALAKLYPIEPFEIIFVDLGVSNWLLAPFIARFVIAFELFLGLCIIFDVWWKYCIYQIAQGSLFLFSAYLIYLLFTEGNSVDCGCFGSFIKMTPLQSILKNGVLMLVLLFLNKHYHHTGLKWLPVLFLIISFASTFLLNKVGIQNIQGKELNVKLDLSGLPKLYDSNQKIDFDSGNKIVAFLSVKCVHCKNVAHKLAYLSNKKEVTNLFLVVGSKHEEAIQPFLEETKLNLPFIWMSDNSFFNYSGGKLPAFIYIEEGVLKKKWTGEFFKVEEIQELLEIEN